MCELAKLLAFLRSAATLACVLETFKMFGIQSFKTERGGKFTSVCHTCCTIHEESNLVSPTALSSLLWSKCLSSERLLTPGILVVYFQRVRFQVMTSCQVMSQWEFFTDLSSIRNSLLSAVHPSSIRTSVNHDEISQEWVSEGLASYTSHLRRPFVDRKTIRRFTTSLTSPPPSLVLASSQEMLRSTALSSFLTKFTASKIEIFKNGIVFALNVVYCCQNNGIMLLDYHLESSSLPSFTPLVSHSRRAPAPLPNEIGSRTMTRRRTRMDMCWPPPPPMPDQKDSSLQVVRPLLFSGPNQMIYSSWKTGAGCSDYNGTNFR